MKIAQYIGKPQGELPGVPSTHAEQAAIGAAAAGMQEINKGLVEVARVGEELWKENRERRRNIDLQNMQIETEKDWLEFKTGYDRSNTNPMNYMKDTEKAWDDIVKKRSAMTKDAITADMYKNKMNSRKLMILHNSQEEANRRFRDAYYFDTMKNIDEWKNLAIQTPDLAQAEIFQNEMLNEINKGYPLDKDKAYAIETKYLADIKAGRQRNAEARLEYDILWQPGNAIIGLMQGLYPEVADEKTRADYLVRAERAFKTNQDQQRQDEARIKQEKHDDEEVALWRIFATGKMTLSDIGNTQYLSGDERYTWQERMENKIKNRANIKTDFRVYSELQDAITTLPKRRVVEMIANASEKNLSENDAEKLLGKLDAHTNSLRDHWIKKGYEFLKSKFVTQRDKLGQLLQTPEEMERYLTGTNILDMEIQTSAQKGQPLEGIDIYNKAVKIWESLKLSPAEKMEEKIKPIKKMQEEKAAAEALKKKGQQPPPAPITPKVLPLRNKNESLDDFLKRITGK
jgi:hypothetical protein